MTLSRNSRGWKRWAGAMILLVVVLDLALIVVTLRAARLAPEQQRKEAFRLRQKAELMDKDIARAEAIRKHLPEVTQNCDHFYSAEFLPAATGYSSVVSDLGELAGHAGLKTSGVTFRQKPVEKRGVVEVDISAAVEGDYPSLIHFINGLERSKNFYLLENLTLASVSPASIKLQLELRTYFRS